jgi:phage recombination protein Bet
MNKKKAAKKAPSQRRTVKKVVEAVPEQKELSVISPPPLPVVTEKDIVTYMEAFSIAGQLDQREKRQFIEVATAYGLNPFKREIYCVAYGEGDKRKLSIITGYEVYLKRAERSGQLDGWNVEFTVSGNDLEAHITIWRKDRSHPVKHSVAFSEYVQTTWKNGKKVPNKFWDEKPKTMLRKVVIAQGFRLAFPDELGGMPYTADELPEEMTVGRMESKTPRATATEVQATLEMAHDDDLGKQKAIDSKIESPQPAPRNVTPDDQGISDAFDSPLFKGGEVIDQTATDSLKAYVESLDWKGKAVEYQAVMKEIKKGLSADHAENIRGRVAALNLKEAVF